MIPLALLDWVRHQAVPAAKAKAPPAARRQSFCSPCGPALLP